MSQAQNPQTPETLIGRYAKNVLGLDMVQIQDNGGNVVYRLNQFQAIWYAGTGNPSTSIPGIIAGNFYIDNSTGNLWYYNGTTWIYLPSGGSGLIFSNDEVIPFSGASGTTANVPNGSFFLLIRNGVVQTGGGVDYFRIGNAITLQIAAQPTDTFVAWYTY